MKSHTIKLKQDNMLCYRCLLNVVQGIGDLSSLQELEINLDSKRIKIKHRNSDISREEVQRIVTNSIEKGVRRKA